jgi:hypothetical protein
MPRSGSFLGWLRAAGAGAALLGCSVSFVACSSGDGETESTRANGDLPFDAGLFDIFAFDASFAPEPSADDDGFVFEVFDAGAQPVASTPSPVPDPVAVPECPTAPSEPAPATSTPPVLDASVPPTADGGAAPLPVGDASVDAGAAGPSFPPALLSRLAFWFDPTSLVATNDRVLEWTDLSGQENHAVQSDVTLAPAYVPSGIGGLPSLDFDATPEFLRLADADGIRWGTEDFVVLVVARASAESGINAMLYQKTGDSPFDGPALFLNCNKPVDSTRAAAQISGETYVVSEGEPSTFVDNTPHVLTARRAGTRLELRVDSAALMILDAPEVSGINVDASGKDGIIGANGYNTLPDFQQVRGQLAELIAVRGQTSDEEVAELEAYLLARYSL